MGIGTIRESSLHAALKQHYTRPGDRVEVQLDGYWVDVLRGEQVIEIQTGNFSALERKLRHFLPARQVRVVLPLAQEKYIVRAARDGDVLVPRSRRRSPRKACTHDLFAEMVHLARIAREPGFSLEVALVAVEEVWLDDGRGSWRRKGVSVVDRRLVAVHDCRVFTGPDDYFALVPATLARPFTVRELAAEIGRPPRLAGQMAWTLREMGVLDAVGKRGNAMLYLARDRAGSRGSSLR